ncbi:SPOC domain-like protein [Ephemerocybe angulata]|uniref:ATP-dependent DNA helicase II subunit 2 n=1 Tax=Ephemerocybe angulata TaxID=980116 RepID=A0A8H6IHX5_9AGAR|nr:SPOC domain-like protein [Tulosesus angulatus]
MPAERAGYTVTMFLVDTSPSMGDVRTVQLPPGPDGEERTTEITNLEWALRYVKTKVQEMIFNGRKTDQCGVIVFGSETTDNIVNVQTGGYENVQEYIPIGTPNVNTLAKLDALEPSTATGDPIDGLIVALETQGQYLAKKKTWTRKIVLVTDGQTEIEMEDWEVTVDRMNELDVRLTIVGVDFDDPDWGYEQPDKSALKRKNEQFFHDLVDRVREGNGVVGTCAHALEEVARPEQKMVRSALMGTTLRLGDPDRNAEEALEIMVKASKATALQRPATMKKFALLHDDPKDDEDGMEVDEEEDTDKPFVYGQLKMRTEYYVDKNPKEDGEDEDTKMEEDEDKKKERLPDELMDKEVLIRGFKYGTTYVPVPDGQFPKLETAKGIDICGFFPAKNFPRELAMGEVQYIWGDPSSPQQQVALSSLVRAMSIENEEKMAIARWVSRDGMDPKMGVLRPCIFDGVDCLLWVQMPFADDVRRYAFASLDHLVSKKGEVITEHPYLPTEEQLEAMDDFVDAMDLMDAGEKDEEGNRGQWFSTAEAFNPAIHRIKQAIFHSAVVSDIATNPLPPPHPDLTFFFEPPSRALKRARKPLEKCKQLFNVKQVPKRVAKAKKDENTHALDEGDGELLLDKKGKAPVRSHSTAIPTATPSESKLKATAGEGSDTESETDNEDDDFLLLDAPKDKDKDKGKGPLPTPARSVSPRTDAVDPERAPGRIIGATHPLKDFQKNIARGDVVTKAVEDLGTVITEIVLKPFASKRTAEMLECMKALRKTCLEEDEVDAWNAFLVTLKKKCLNTKKPQGNTAFWGKVQVEGRELSLISDKEAKKHGGVSQYSEQQAEEFPSDSP